MQIHKSSSQAPVARSSSQPARSAAGWQVGKDHFDTTESLLSHVSIPKEGLSAWRVTGSTPEPSAVLGGLLKGLGAGAVGGGVVGGLLSQVLPVVHPLAAIPLMATVGAVGGALFAANHSPASTETSTRGTLSAADHVASFQPQRGGAPQTLGHYDG